jgi:glutathione peroxidase-family protein
MGAAKSALGIGGDKPLVRVKSFYQLQSRRAENHENFDFEQLRGKVVLISNVASKCGLTDSMYKILGSLAQKYGPTNEFVVLGFPCGQFMNQEFKSTEETCPFVRGILSKFGEIQDKGHFILMEKVDVNGPETHPVFSFLKYNSSLYDETKDSNSPIKWNFGKFLIDKEGRVIKYYGPTDEYLDADVQAALEGKLVGAPVRPAKM